MGSVPTSPDPKHNNNNSDTAAGDSPDNLWRRTPVRNEIGVISSLGRYQPRWREAPDTSPDQARSRFSKAVKKLVTNEDHEKMKEEMAWQVAEMFVKDVTNITLSADNSQTNLSKSFSEYSLVDSNLDLDSVELPSAKYF